MLPSLLSNDGTKTFTEKESAFDRVIRTGTLRCGYYPYDPSTIIDSKTGEITGINGEVMKIIGERLNLKIEWVEEVGLASMLDGLNQGRYDAVCTTLWPITDRARHAVFSEPLWYSAVAAYARVDDNRFDKDISVLNSNEYTISAIDGSIPYFMAQENFPKAQVLSMSDLTDYSLNLLNVQTGKADVTFAEQYQGEIYFEKNPGVLKNITEGKPLRVYGNTIIMPRDEYDFAEMINIAIREQINNGVIDKIIDKHEKYPGSFYRVAKPYEAREN